MTALPEPGAFDHRTFTGEFVDSMAIALAPSRKWMVVSMTGSDGESLLYRTNAAGARQLAAWILNKADEVDDS